MVMQWLIVALSILYGQGVNFIFRITNGTVKSAGDGETIGSNAAGGGTGLAIPPPPP